METGLLNRQILIQTITTTENNGDITQVLSVGDIVRANVIQVDGTRYLSENELIDRAVYKITLWDNSYSDNLKITYGSLVMYPIRPITRNPGKSMMNEIVILAATKK